MLGGSQLDGGGYDFVEPVPAVGVDEGVAGGHFGDVLGRVKVIAFDEGEVCGGGDGFGYGCFAASCWTADNYQGDILRGSTVWVLGWHC